MKTAAPAIFVFSLATAYAGARGEFSGVILEESTRSIRPLLRSEGGVSTGSPAVRNVEYASLSPDGRTALAVRDGAVYLIRRLNGAIPVWRELPAGPFRPGRAVWSAKARAVALIPAGDPRIELWKNVDSDPAAAGVIETDLVNGRIVSLAVDDEAREVFLATQDESGGTIWAAAPGQVPRMILSLAQAGELRLEGGALYAADRGRSEILKITSWDVATQVSTVAMQGHGILDPVAFALSGDQKMIWIASRGTRQVVALDIARGAVRAAIDLDFAPARFQTAAGSLIYVSGGAAGVHPARLIETGSLEVYEVPVSASAAE